MKVSQALVALRPGAEWSMDNEDFSTLTWLDKVQNPPTSQEVSDFIASSAQDDVTKSQVLTQAKSTLKDAKATTDDKLNALIKILGL